MPKDNSIIMGFDFGQRYIGFAVGQTLTFQARAIGSLPAEDGRPDKQRLNEAIQAWQPDEIVVGLPLNMDGSMSHMAFCARKFANRLQQDYKMPVHLVDERLSSYEAKQGLAKDASRSEVNGAAAQVILQQWLRSRERT